MHNINDQLRGKLIAFAHRQLKKGEVFLLAKAIADRIPLPPSDTESVRIYTLQHRNHIDTILYGLSDFIYIPKETIDTVYRLIDELLMWRMAIAYNPPTVMFSGEPNNVIDDLTGILRFVNVGDICTVGDIASTAQYTQSLFQEVVSACA